MKPLSHFFHSALSLRHGCCWILLLLAPFLCLNGDITITNEMMGQLEALEKRTSPQENFTNPLGADIFIDGSSLSSTMGRMKETNRPNSAVSGVFDPSLIGIDSEAKQNISKDQPALLARTGGTSWDKNAEIEFPQFATQNSLGLKIRTLVIMLAVVSIPLALVIALLNYTVKRRTRRHHKSSMDHVSGWQS